MKILRSLTIALLIGLFGFLTALCGQDKPPAASATDNSRPTTTIKAESRLVVVDVTVVDSHGNPVSGLTKDDFAVMEDGKPQQVKVFEKHGLVNGGAPVAATPAESKGPESAQAAAPVTAPKSTDPGPLNIVLLDSLNTLAQDQVRARQQMIELLKTLPPGRRIAIFTLTNRVKELQNFTTDRAALIAAVDKTMVGRSMLSSESKKN